MIESNQIVSLIDWIDVLMNGRGQFAYEWMRDPKDNLQKIINYELTRYIYLL